MSEPKTGDDISILSLRDSRFVPYEDWVELSAAYGAAKRRIAELEDAPVPVEPKPPPVKPPDPLPAGLPRVPLEPPHLKYNSGSWDNNTGQVVSHNLLSDGTLQVWIAQKKQPKSRVIRRDWGLQSPDFPPGQGPHLREPKEKLRRYELRVKIPADYSGKGEMCTLGLKFHPHTAGFPGYLAFLAWTSTVRWRINHPEGIGRTDSPPKGAPIKKGHTYHLVVEAFWSPGDKGRLTAWTDGELQLEYKGANYSKDEAKPPYLLVGAYFPSAIEEFSEVFEFSELRVGDIS